MKSMKAIEIEIAEKEAAGAAFAAKHGLTLERVKFCEWMSEETICFTVVIMKGRFSVGDAENDGHGGSTMYHLNASFEARNEAPEGFDYWIDKVIGEMHDAQQTKKFMEKGRKAALKGGLNIAFIKEGYLLTQAEDTAAFEVLNPKYKGKVTSFEIYRTNNTIKAAAELRDAKFIEKCRQKALMGRRNMAVARNSEGRVTRVVFTACTEIILPAFREMPAWGGKLQPTDTVEFIKVI